MAGKSAYYITFLLFALVAADPCIVNKYEEVEPALSCKEIVLNNLFVPAGKTLQLTLTEGAEVVFRGNTTFGFEHWWGPLVMINGTNVTVRGENDSVIDGLGQSYWDGQGGWSNAKPEFFTIQAYSSVFKDIYIVNTPKDVVLLTDSDNVVFSNWYIDDYAGDPGVAEEGKEGHNTDGFLVWNSTNVVIKDSKIYNQDDCVAVRCGANISISNLYCHGSHGLSLSVGFSNDSRPMNTLLNVSFTDCIMDGGRNGIHVKTHGDAGYGDIIGVLYRNITMKDITYNGVLIQENYSNQPPNSTEPNPEPNNNIPITNLILEDVTGSVQDTATPIEIICADEGCFDWEWARVDVKGKLNNSCNFEPNGFTC